MTDQVSAEPDVQNTKPRLTNLDQFTFDPSKDYPEEPPIFEGLLSRRDLVVWLGREKHRKSNLMLQAAICAATGRDYLTFRFTAPGPLRVTYLDYESKAKKFQQRYNSICDARHLTPEERVMLKENLRVILVTEALRKGAPFKHFPVGTPNKPKTDFLDVNDPKVFWELLEEDFRADIYFIDPMRLFHGEDENSSKIEELFHKIRAWAREAAVIFAHHLSKTDWAEKALKSLNNHTPFSGDLRVWSDSARGSTAIKAHSDTIVCQERIEIVDKNGDKDETVYLGAFGKDAPDIGPLTLKETGYKSFTWAVKPDLGKLSKSYEILAAHGGPFREKKDAVQILTAGNELSRATAFRRVDAMIEQGLLYSENGGFVIRKVG